MKLIGTITTSDGSSKTNGNTAATFSLPSKFLVQAVTVDVYIEQVSSSSGTATSSHFKVPLDAIVEVEMVPGMTHLAMLPASGNSASLKVGIR